LVDDSLRYATDCSSNGIACVLFGDYAWNRSPAGADLPQRVRRASSWEEVEATIASLLNPVAPRELPIGWGSRFNALAPEATVTAERVGDWATANLAAKYVASGPLEFGVSRRNTMTIDALSRERSAVAVAVAEVNSKPLAYPLSRGTDEPANSRLQNGEFSLNSILVQAVLKMDSRMKDMEAKLDEVLKLQQKILLSIHGEKKDDGAIALAANV